MAIQFFCHQENEKLFCLYYYTSETIHEATIEPLTGITLVQGCTLVHFPDDLESLALCTTFRAYILFVDISVTSYTRANPPCLETRHQQNLENREAEEFVRQQLENAV